MKITFEQAKKYLQMIGEYLEGDESEGWILEKYKKVKNGIIEITEHQFDENKNLSNTIRIKKIKGN